MPDDRSGEAVLLLVVASDPTLDADTVQRHCHERLARYKCPRTIEFRESLPKTPIGKVLKRELRPSMPATH